MIRSISYKCCVCNVTNSEILPELTEKSNQECAEARELASQIQFKNSKPRQEEEEDKSQPELIRRNVTNSRIEREQPNLQSSVPSVNNPNRTTTNTVFNNSSLAILIVLSGLFIFLLLRRIYLIVDKDPFSV